MARPRVAGEEKAKLVRLNLTLPYYVYEWLADECAKSGETITAFIRELIYRDYEKRA